MTALDSIVLGIDYSHEYIQISYFNKNMEKPESIGPINDNYKELIPNIESIINIALEKTGFEKISSIVFTMEEFDKELIEDISEVVYELGYRKENIRFLSHMESLFYYIINQPKSLWTNDVALFDFNKDQFKYYLMSVNNRRVPYVVTLEDKDFNNFISSNLLNTEDGMKLADLRFADIIKENINSRLVSAVYLVGSGFKEKWFIESINLLCNKRKVFQGQNLFCSGACYYLYAKDINVENYLLLCYGRTKVDVNLLISHHGESKDFLLTKAGENLNEASRKIQCILDDTMTIELEVNSPVTKKSRGILIDLEGFPIRQRKTTRIELEISYPNDTQFIVSVKDMGFGDLFKSSDKVVEQIVDLEYF